MLFSSILGLRIKIPDLQVSEKTPSNAGETPLNTGGTPSFMGEMNKS